MELEFKLVWGGNKSKAWSLGNTPSSDITYTTPHKIKIYLPRSYDDRSCDIVQVKQGTNLHKFVYLHYSQQCSWDYALRNYVSDDGIGKPRKDQYLGPDAHILAYYQIARGVYTVDIYDAALGEVWKGDLPMEELIKLQS